MGDGGGSDPTMGSRVLEPVVSSALPPGSGGAQHQTIRKRSRRPVTVTFIDPRPLTRASISAMLAGAAPDFEVHACAEAADVLVDSTLQGRIALAVVAIGTARVGDERVRTTLDTLAHLLAETPVILLAESTEMDDIMAALKLGVRGYIPTSTQPGEAVQALRLVLAGGVFLPAAAVVEFFDGRDPNRKTRDFCRPPQPLERLTQREQEVLAHLQKGKANKMIAYELDLHPSTVKIHIRNIKRKLGAANRTEAALLAERLSASGSSPRNGADPLLADCPSRPASPARLESKG